VKKVGAPLNWGDQQIREKKNKAKKEKKSVTSLEPGKERQGGGSCQRKVFSPNISKQKLRGKRGHQKLTKRRSRTRDTRGEKVVGSTACDFSVPIRKGGGGRVGENLRGKKVSEVGAGEKPF